MNISHVVIPNDHICEAVENSWDFNDSGATHLNGKGICNKVEHRSFSAFHYHKLNKLVKKDYIPYVTLPAINSRPIKLPCQTKVRDFDDRIGKYEDVPSCKVPMNNLHRMGQNENEQQQLLHSNGCVLTPNEAICSMPPAIC